MEVLIWDTSRYVNPAELLRWNNICDIITARDKDNMRQ